METVFRKILKSFLLPALVFSLLLLFAPEAQASASGQWGNISWTLNSSGTLTVSGSGEIEEMPYTNSEWLAYAESVKKVVIKDGVTGIGKYAFYHCTNLTAVTFPDSMESIGTASFEGCSSLKELVFPENVSYILDYAFRDCASLTTVIFPRDSTGFGYNHPYFDIREFAFLNCSNLQYAVFGSGQNIDDSAFDGCNNVIFVGMGGGPSDFASANGITYLHGGAWGNLIWIRYNDATSLMIFGAGKMKDMSDWVYNDEDVYPEEWRLGFETVENVVIVDGVTSIGAYAFQGMSELKSISIPASVTSIGSKAFSDCPGLTEFTVDAESTSFTTLGDILFSKNYNRLLCYPAGKPGSSYNVPACVNTIGSNAFDSCVNLTHVTVPGSVKCIQNYAFRNCANLKSILFSRYTAGFSEYSSIYYRWRPENLILTVFPGSDALDYAVSENYAYRIPDVLNLPLSVTSVPAEAFSGSRCEAVIIPDGCTSIGSGAFADCTRLAYVCIPSSVTDIADDAFQGCGAVYRDYQGPIGPRIQSYIHNTSSAKPFDPALDLSGDGKIDNMDYVIARLAGLY